MSDEFSVPPIRLFSVLNLRNSRELRQNAMTSLGLLIKLLLLRLGGPIILKA